MFSIHPGARPRCQSSGTCRPSTCVALPAEARTAEPVQHLHLRAAKTNRGLHRWQNKRKLAASLARWGGPQDFTCLSSYRTKTARTTRSPLLITSEPGRKPECSCLLAMDSVWIRCTAGGCLASRISNDNHHFPDMMAQSMSTSPGEFGQVQGSTGCKGRGTTGQVWWRKGPLNCSSPNCFARSRISRVYVCRCSMVTVAAVVGVVVCR